MVLEKFLNYVQVNARWKQGAMVMLCKMPCKYDIMAVELDGNVGGSCRLWNHCIVYDVLWWLRCRRCVGIG